jgi:hypothetical protein
MFIGLFRWQICLCRLHEKRTIKLNGFSSTGEKQLAAFGGAGSMENRNSTCRGKTPHPLDIVGWSLYVTCDRSKGTTLKVHLLRADTLTWWAAFRCEVESSRSSRCESISRPPPVLSRVHISRQSPDHHIVYLEFRQLFARVTREPSNFKRRRERSFVFSFGDVGEFSSGEMFRWSRRGRRTVRFTYQP